AAAARATAAANTASTLAGRAAAAAAVARDAANSAATHAEKAAAAADEAAAHAGQAVEYAKRSTESANAAVEAANTATNAVKEAQEVEKAARTAETERIEADTAIGVELARLAAQEETADLAKANRERTQADRTSSDIKDLVAAAEAAVAAGDTATAVDKGRRAALLLLDNSGSWTRQAAEYALSGTEYDVLNWLAADRALAEGQDDRETVVTVAEISRISVAQAAADTLASTAPDAVRTFLTTGAVEAAKTDNRVLVFNVLGASPGAAVKAKAQAALDDGSAIALHRFLQIEHAEAIKEDDRVEIFKLLAGGGQYMKSAAQIVLEGPARMRRNFVAHDQYDVARLDQDAVAHISAIRAAIAHAAKVAAKAQEDAALASKAAAEARQAADEAIAWKNKADGYAADAQKSAAEAKSNADAADKSAADAAKSAATAQQAAAVARTAARTANYSARRAAASASQAVASASSAQASATAARASAVQAGKDAQAAAAAASDANRIYTAKVAAEAKQRAMDAADKARGYESNGTNPSQNADSDKPWYVDWGIWPDDVGSASEWSTVVGHYSTILGGGAVALGVASLFFPPLAPIAIGVGIASVVVQGVSAFLALAGNDWNWQSKQFQSAFGLFGLGLVTLGVGGALSRVGLNYADDAIKLADTVGGKVVSVAGDVTTTVVGLLTW
ncbi:ALF repeat-containing protein, partial [Streptomyces acidiscabies]|nr:ALF repeat-containing protein [Streptomyces acidiscabies]